MDKLERGGGRRGGGGAARERADGKGEVYRGLDLEQQLRVNRTSFPVLLLQPHASFLLQLITSLFLTNTDFERRLNHKYIS